MTLKDDLTLEQKVDLLLELHHNASTTKKQGAINALYSVLGTIIIISLTFAFSFITEIRATNQRQDRDLIERTKIDQQKWIGIDYNFDVLNKNKLPLYQIRDNEIN